MSFQPPTTEEILSAIGRTDGLPVELERALTPDDDFESIPVPRRGDWLAEHDESGQTFDEYVGVEAQRPDPVRDIIYLQPFGPFENARSPSLELLREYAAAYFSMDAKMLMPRALTETPVTTRENLYTHHRQLLTIDILKALRQLIPDDAFCILAVTMEDLYPDPRWNFVFGQASLRDRVGVFSFARYDPVFYGEPYDHRYQEVLLRRSMKVLAHETAHMFSLAHCIYFKCVMNGSNHLQESDARPLSLCPVCLHKLQHSVNFDVIDRYRRLFHVYREIGFLREADWVSRRLERITGK